MMRAATDTGGMMRARVRSLALGLVAVLVVATLALSGWLALPAMAQQSGSSDSGSGQAPSSSSTPSKPQTPPAHKSTAQDNPFPADVSKQAAQQQSQPPDTPAGAPTDAPAAPDAGPQAPQSGQKPGSTAKDNPFPEDVSKGAEAAAAKDSGASGSSSSSSSSSASGDANPDADVPSDNGRRKLRKPSDKDIQSGSLAGEGRAQEDVKVGRFYLGAGDYKGAYGRFTDAARMDPTNLDAIYGLAAAAAALHRNDEALTNYKLYLQIAPDGNDAKSARKALRTLSK
jgi:tetratricopeptide (TPR) repeat protein